MIGVSINIDLVKLMKELASYHPDSILQRAKDLRFDPRQACHHYLVYLSRVGTQPGARGIVPAANYLFAHYLNRVSLSPKELILRGNAKIEGKSVVLRDDESVHSQVVVPLEIGKGPLWGMRYRISIEDGIEAKISISDMTFAICTEHHPAKSRVFLYDKERDAFRAILQESHLVARKGYSFLATLLLLDRNVWYIVGDKTVFAIELSGDDLEKWRMAQPRLGTWRSRCVRIRDVSVFTFEEAAHR